MSDGVTNLSVTPGRGRKPESPESIGSAAGYGFRPRRFAAPRNDRRMMWRLLRLGAAVALLMIIMMTGVGWWWVASLGPVPRGENLAFSTLVVDRDGRLLRPYTTTEGRWRLPATPMRIAASRATTASIRWRLGGRRRNSPPMGASCRAPPR